MGYIKIDENNRVVTPNLISEYKSFGGVE